MKSTLKWFIIGIIVVALGAAIMITTLSVYGWTAASPAYTLTTYTEQNENTSLEIEIGSGNVKTEFYDGDKIEITYPNGSSYNNSFDENAGKLLFRSEIKWYASFFGFGIWNSPDIVIKIPKDRIPDLYLDISAGTVNLASGTYNKIKLDVSAGKLDATSVYCSELECDLSAGTLDLQELTCPVIDLDVSAGSLKLGVVGDKNEYNITVDISAGSCNVSTQTGTNDDKRISVDVSAGSVDIKFS